MPTSTLFTLHYATTVVVIETTLFTYFIGKYEKLGSYLIFKSVQKL